MREMEMPNNDAYKTQRNTSKRTEAQMQCYSSRLLLTLTRWCRQTHKYAEGWQHCDRPWMITSWPSGPSPQILLSGFKSGLSLYANQPCSQPANHSPPCCQPLPITALWLTMPSIINIKPSEKQKRSDIIESRRHELIGILSALLPVHVHSNACWLEGHLQLFLDESAD